MKGNVAGKWNPAVWVWLKRVATLCLIVALGAVFWVNMPSNGQVEIGQKQTYSWNWQILAQAAVVIVAILGVTVTFWLNVPKNSEIRLIHESIKSLRTDLVSVQNEIKSLGEKVSTLGEKVATKEDLRAETDNRRKDMNNLREDMNNFREDMNNLREDMKSGFDRLDARIEINNQNIINYLGRRQSEDDK